MSQRQKFQKNQTKSTAEKTGFVQRQVDFIYKHALAIVIAFAVGTAAILPLVAGLKLHANFLELLPQNHPSIQNLKELLSHVGGTSFLIAVIESPDEKTSRDAAKLFADRAASFPLVEFVDNRTDIPAFANRKLLFLKLKSLETLKQKVEDIAAYHRRANNPFYLDLEEEKEPELDMGSLELEEKLYKIGGFSSKEKDSFMQVVLIKPKYPVGDFAKSKTLFDMANSTFADIQKELGKPVKLGLTGTYKTRYAEYKTIVRDLQWTGILATVFLVIINFVGFRNFRSLIYAYVPLIIGTFWIWAFTKVSIGYLNLITAFLAAILFGMGGDYTFHILVSFEDDLRETGDVKKAISRTYHELWNPLWSSMWTTAVVFYAMIVSKFEGFRHFGIIAGVGIVISFVIVIYLQPALMVLGERYFPIKRPPIPKPREVSKVQIYLIIIAGLLFSVYSLIQIPNMRFDYDFSNLQAKDDDALELAERVGTHFGVHLNPVVYITPDRAHATELARNINAYIETHPKTTFDFAAAVTSHVPRQQEEKIKVLGEIDAVLQKHDAILQKLDPEKRDKIDKLREQLHPTPFGLNDLPDGFQNQYEGRDRKISAVFIYPTMGIRDGENAKKFVKEARNYPTGPGIKLAGEAVIYADILSLLERDTPIALAISTIVVFALVFWHFKRLDHVLWVHLPFVIGVLWMIGMMGASHLKFNFFNMLIIPSILGVGIDNGIYIFDRYKERKNENFIQTMHKSIKGVMLSSATNISAFASVMFAYHCGMASMGKLAVFGFTSCLLASVFFVPALIEFYELKYSHLFRRGNKT